VILIDNLKIVRDFNFIIKFNKNLQNYHYIFFCYNVLITTDIKKKCNNKNIKYFYLKNLKSIKYLKFLYNYLNNSMILFCCNDLNSVNFLLNSLQNIIIFIKINNNYYSLNNKNLNINANLELITFLNTYLINSINIFSKFKISLKN
jgi:hypothetical protein